jgi:hypothetical protein
VPWRASATVDWDGDPQDPPPSSGRRAGSLIVGVVLLLILIPYRLVDVMHPRDRIVNTGTVSHCVLVGGSWPVEAAPLVGLRNDARVGRIGAVSSDDVWVADIEIFEEGASTRPEAAFILGDRAGPRMGALDATARRLASVHSPDSSRSHWRDIRAARECLDRHLP